MLHFLDPIKPWMLWSNPCVAEFWRSYANILELGQLKPLHMTTLNLALALATTLDIS
jgi:lipopolysaccharide biosynthesis glycosyltransferase